MNLVKITLLLKKKIVRDAFALYLGRGLNLSVGVISTIIYGAIFFKSQIALISLFEMIVNLFISFGFTWSTTGIVRFGRESFEKSRSLNYVSNTRLHLVFPLLFFSIGLILLFKDNLLEFIGSDSPILIYVLILNIILMVIHEHINSLFNAAEKHYANVVFQVAHSFSKLIILFLFIQNILELNALYYIYLSVGALALLIFLRIPFIESTFIFPLTWIKRSDFIPYIKFVSPQIYGFAGTYLINWMDLYFLRQYTSYDDLGAYQFLYSIFLKITSFAFLLNILFFPRIMSWKESNPEALNKYIQKIPIIILLITSLGMVILLLLYQPFFSLFFDNKYNVAYPAFNILLISVPFFFVSFLFIPVMNSYDRVSFIQVTNIISASGNLIIDYIFIQKYGLIAAAIGTHFAYILQFQLLLFGIKNLFNIRTLYVNIINLLITGLTIGYFLVVTNIY